MGTIVEELDQRLRTLDPLAAIHMEKLVREALALVEEKAEISHRWPETYFDRTAGALADEPFDRPDQQASEIREGW